jgi:Flp pilus assembly protein TadD/TolB-like protein
MKMLWFGAAQRGLRLILSILISALAVPFPADAAKETKPSVALLPVVPSNSGPADSWLTSTVFHRLYRDFRQLSSIKLVEPASVEEAYKAEKLKPDKMVDEARASALGKRLKADLVVATTYELLADENVSLKARLIEPKSSSTKSTLISNGEVDRLLVSLATITLNTASKMNYPVNGEERKSIRTHPTSSFKAFSDYQRALATYDVEAGTGNLSEAVALLANAVKRDPRFGEARFRLSLLDARQGRSDQAAENLQRLVEDDASYPHAQHNLGLAKFNLGDYDAAKRELLKTYQVNPHRVNLLNDLALANYYLKDYESARSQLAKASELAPESPVVWNNTGTIAYAQGNFAEAKKAYVKAIQSNPKSVSSHYNLGLACLQLAEMDEAKKAFEKTLEIDPHHTKSYYSLALIAESDGAGKADSYWKKYLELAKEDPVEQPFIEFAISMLNKTGTEGRNP